MLEKIWLQNLFQFTTRREEHESYTLFTFARSSAYFRRRLFLVESSSSSSASSVLRKKLSGKGFLPTSLHVGFIVFRFSFRSTYGMRGTPVLKSAARARSTVIAPSRCHRCAEAIRVLLLRLVVVL